MALSISLMAVGASSNWIALVAYRVCFSAWSRRACIEAENGGAVAVAGWAIGTATDGGGLYLGGTAAGGGCGMEGGLNGLGWLVKS